MGMNGAVPYACDLSRVRETPAEPRPETKHSIGASIHARIFRLWVLAALYCGGFTVVFGCSGGSGSDRGSAPPSARADQEVARIWKEFGVCAIPPSADADDEIARIWKEFGVRVHVTYDRESYFPTRWKRAPISVQGIQIEPEGAMQLRRVIPGFLAMYPRVLFANNLRNIYLLKSLSLYGLKYGGTYSRGSIYIASRGEDHGRNDLFLSATMHSEFSSILYRNYDFPTREWSKINESGWRYVGSGKDLLGRPNLLHETEDLLRSGFICAYGQASIEEDVNMYVFSVIHRWRSLNSAAARYKRVKQKLEILTQFYERVNQQVNRSGGDFEFLTQLKDAAVPLLHASEPPLFVASQAGSDLGVKGHAQQISLTRQRSPLHCAADNFFE